jgi:tetratricopeptide (TPR) repeat protein
MSLPVLLLIEGFAYVVIFGGLSLLRREGLSLRFAIEATLITLVVSGLTALTGYPTHPALFLFLVYLLTMRVRLLVDVGNSFAERKHFDRAEALYLLASRLRPDSAGKLIIQLNRAVMSMQQGAIDNAIAALTGILQKAGEGFLGLRHEAAAHYNLGVAYRRKGLEAQAIREFNAVIDTWPASPYARRAAEALEQLRQKP